MRMRCAYWCVASTLANRLARNTLHAGRWGHKRLRSRCARWCVANTSPCYPSRKDVHAEARHINRVRKGNARWRCGNKHRIDACEARRRVSTAWASVPPVHSSSTCHHTQAFAELLRPFGTSATHHEHAVGADVRVPPSPDPEHLRADGMAVKLCRAQATVIRATHQRYT